MRSSSKLPTPAKSRTLLRALLCGACTLVAGCGEIDGDQPPEASSSATWVLSDGLAIDFDYSHEEMFEFRIDEYLQSHAPHLLPHAEAISHVAAQKRISPRLLIALMEQQSGAVGTAASAASKPFGKLSDKNGFLEQFRDVCTRLRASTRTDDSAAAAKSPQDAMLTVVSPEDLGQLGSVYKRLFPGVVSQKKTVVKGASQVAMQFPFPVGKKWVMGGTHSDSGSGSVMSSLDFMSDDYENWGEVVTENVTAAAPGRAVRHSSCYVSIVHDGGWSTGYYHLDSITIRTGDTVAANQPIAKYANRRAQALCDGGSSDGPHVHWTLYSSNREASLSGQVLSGWTVHPGSSNYDDNCARMYFLRDGRKMCPWTPAINEGIVGQVPPGEPAKIEMTQPAYAVNEPIVVRYDNLPGNSLDWVGIFNAGAANTADLEYAYSNGATSGTMQFAGRPAGSYEARLFFNDSYTLEHKIAFTVGGSPVDSCPNDPDKTEPGLCGCGVPEGACGTSQTLRLSPTEDAYVTKTSPGTNYGKATTLLVDASPLSRALLKFAVSTLPGKVMRATLRIYVTNGTSDGPKIFKANTNSWTENAVTWNNRPSSSGSAIADAASISSGWLEIDVTRAILSAGTYSFVLLPDSSDGLHFASRESANSPELVVVTGS